MTEIADNSWRIAFGKQKEGGKAFQGGEQRSDEHGGKDIKHLFRLLPDTPFQQHQNQNRCKQGRHQEGIGAHDGKKNGGANQARKCWEMIGKGAPLIDKNDDEQSRHGKIHPVHIEGDSVADHSTQEAADDPIAVIEKCDQKGGLFLIYVLRELAGAQHRVGFICQCENVIEGVLSPLLHLIQETEP